jgi:hydrogenase nickel incorporation protein HypA/HybF
VHELSICGSIADIVARHAASRRVAAIHVRIGQLRQIVLETLVYCWSLVSADTELDGSVLDVERVRARIACRDCGQSSEIGDFPVFVCSACNSVEVSVVAGEEFLITSMDLAEV